MNTTTERIKDTAKYPCPDYPEVKSKGHGLYRELACEHALKMAELLDRAKEIIHYQQSGDEWLADFELFQKGKRI